MKVIFDTTLDAPPEADLRLFQIPQGLVGFPEYKTFDIFFDPEQQPFRWLRLNGPAPLQFVVIEPGGIIPDYEIELFDDDAAYLGIEDSSDAIVLNVVTVGRTLPATATVNLVGPIVINRHSGLAKQVVLANHGRYSVRHALVTAS